MAVKLIPNQEMALQSLSDTLANQKLGSTSTTMGQRDWTDCEVQSLLNITLEHKAKKKQRLHIKHK